MWLQLYHNIFRLQIRMYNITMLMQIHQTQKRIYRNLFNQPQRHSLLIKLIMLYHIQQIRPQNLKY